MMYRTESAAFLERTGLVKKQKEPPFIIKSSEIPPQMEITRKIDYDRLLSKPRHKPNRLKFDKNKIECLKEKENNPMTK